MAGLFDEIRRRGRQSMPRTALATATTPPEIAPNPLSGNEIRVAMPPATTGLQRIQDGDVEEYRQHGPREVTLSTPWGNVHLVKERTGAERFEITPEELQKIAALQAMFEGEVVELGYEKPATTGPDRAKEIHR